MRNLTDRDIDLADRYRDDCDMLQRYRVEEGFPDAGHADSGFYVWCINQAVAEPDRVDSRLTR